jgi:hypothetical protein
MLKRKLPHIESSSPEDRKVLVEVAVGNNAQHHMIGQLHHSRCNVFRLPAGFNSGHSDIGEPARHRFLTLQESIRLLVGRGRGYPFHNQEISPASSQSSTEDDEINPRLLAELFGRGSGSAQTEEIRR